MKTKASRKTAAILQKDASVLRGIAQEVPVESIGSPKIAKLLKSMAAAIASRDDAVAIAAPQLGSPLRIFMVAGKIFESDQNDNEEASYASRNFVFINPVITKLSKRKERMEEGCLSVDGLYGMVRRAQKATVRAYDEHGNAFEWGGSGLLAQIFQHEVDHLNGVLFIDVARDIRKAEPNELPTLAS